MKSLLFACFALLMAGTTVLRAQSSESSALVDEAWKALEVNDQAKAEESFNAAIKKDPGNSRAYIGLSYLYYLHQKHQESWKAFQHVLHIEKNPYPYLYAAIVTPKMSPYMEGIEDEVVPILKKTAESADEQNILQAMACERLGEYYQNKAKLSNSKEFYARMNSVKDWQMIGPFENISASGYARVYPPENEFNPGKTYTGYNDMPVQWFVPSALRTDGWIDFNRYFPVYREVYYANTFVYSPTKQNVDLRIGTSGFFKAYLNDEVALQTEDEFNNDLDTYIAEVQLQQGWNRLLMKCGSSEFDRCNFMVRITNAAGQPIPGLKYSAETQQYAAKPGATVTVKENVAENFFKKRIDEHPEYLENYLLLADCYLRNDKATDAELILRKALKRAPNSIVLLNHMMEAYIRGRKYDEIVTTLEKISAMKVKLPGALEYEFNRHIQNKEYDKAEEVLSQYQEAMPGSETYYRLAIQLYGAKEQYEKVMTINEEAYKKYPANRDFMIFASTIAGEVHHDRDASIRILRDYLSRSYTDENLALLAAAYLKSSNISKWEDTYEKMFEIEPPAPGYYYQMANVYFTLQDYDKSEKAIRQAIQLCPGNSRYKVQLGEIYRVRKQTDQAKEMYREALRCNSNDYGARASLRELEGKPSIFSHFESVNIDSLVKHSPGKDIYPNSNAVYLLDQINRVIYEQGASETSQELLIKVFNSEGIDAFKEYTIGYNSHAEDLVVEKAVVMKGNGTEIKADINENYIVFKSLTENDHIYIKWKTKSYYAGKLHNHFWDNYYFNSYYPMLNVRYSLLAPKDYKFNYKVQNMQSEPVKRETDDGTLYLWTSSNEPAIVYEAGMPDLEEIGKVLTISTIKDWSFMVDWYGDLAQTKTRSSYEIEEQVQELLKDNPKASEEEIMKKVYEFITENIRYSSVSFRQSGWIPQKARDVLVNKIGDCKDVATLCIAMLNKAGVKANYVLVKTGAAGNNTNPLPQPGFDHCIVGVETKSGIKFLDLTASNYPIGSVPSMDIDGFALLIKPGVKEPTLLTRSHFVPGNVHSDIKVTVRDDNSVTVDRSSVMTGALTAPLRKYFRNKGRNEQEKAITESLGSTYPNVKLKNFDIINLDNLEPRLVYHNEFEVPQYVTEAGNFKIVQSPWAYKEESEEALSYDKRTYPYNYYPGADTVVEEAQIFLPQGYAPVDLPKETRLGSPIADYTLNFSYQNGVIKGKRTFINKKNVVELAEYDEFKKFYNSVVKEDSRQILLQPSKGEPATKKNEGKTRKR